jgi:hypothetical protein
MENKTGSSGHVSRSGKYFKYAIGEIILVVIGILIALQINNWNEDNKTEVFEQNILKEIHKTLNEDINFFDLLEKRIIRKDTAIDNLLFARNGEKTFTDKALIANIESAHSGILFSYNIGPYEALKSSGLDKIKTDSLRYHLTKYYEVQLPRANAFFKNTEDRYEPYIAKENDRIKELGYFKGYFDYHKSDEGDKGYFVETNYNLDKYLNDPAYHDILLLEAGYKRDNWYNILWIKRVTKKLEEEIEQELETRFNETNL